MRWIDSAIGARLFMLAGGPACLALRFWRRNAHTAPTNPEVDLRSELTFNRSQGFLDLVLVNRCRMKLWVVDVTLELSALEARYQTCAPTATETIKLRQVIGPGQSLRASCITALYNGAGRPQEEYAFMVSARTRYRAHGDLFEQVLRPCQVRMIALSPIAVRRIRWYEKPAQPALPAGALPQLEPADLKWLDLETAARR